ncbi:class I SAM-dependent methyltransferase [Faunimonas sp. B44]|uniref:class I SAM-dependent methyltransferase n=1 Tax=Faunimonas sp. B44 TaxID=3461493 RepID=UPI004043E47E
MAGLRQRQLDAARAIVAHAAERLGADLSVKLWDGSIVPLGPGARSDITLTVKSPAVIRRLVLSPRLMTVFELYAVGAIDVEGATPIEAARRWDHLKALHLARTVDRTFILKSLWPFLVSGSAERGPEGYRARVPTRFGKGRDDQELIRFHYDVSNDFYALFLDPEMVYSSAYFARPDMSLEEAQIAKLDMICRRLRLQPGERFLDIGCGWGGLVCHAARNYGVTALGVTLSRQQYDYAQAKIRRLGLEAQVKVELRDYRTVDEPEGFDKIAQIEMFEHVGLDNHDAHFKQMHRLLRPRGLYLHQASTRRPTWNPKHFRKPTAYQKVITRFIFPGGELDHIGMTVTNLERHAFEVHDVEAWREHFQKTLEHWTARLAANRTAAEAEIGAAKTRLWLLYFSLFALAFERNTTFVFQTLASKRQPGPSGLPFSRADLYRDEIAGKNAEPGAAPPVRAVETA